MNTDETKARLEDEIKIIEAAIESGRLAPGERESFRETLAQLRRDLDTIEAAIAARQADRLGDTP